MSGTLDLLGGLYDPGLPTEQLSAEGNHVRPACKLQNPRQRRHRTLYVP